MLGLAALLAFALTARTAAAPTLTLKFAAINFTGAKRIFPVGVSEANVIVGAYYDTAEVLHGFALKGKTVTTIDYPNAKHTACNHISPNGTAIVGYYSVSGGPNTLGFLWKNKKFTNIPGPLGSIATDAYGINDADVIVGEYKDSSSAHHGFILKGGKYTILNVPGAVDTRATGINNHGDIVVVWDSKTTQGSSLYKGKTYTPIDVPGSKASFAADISTSGDVVYFFADSTGTHGALRKQGKYYKFDDPLGVGRTLGHGLNDHGKIVGAYLTNGNGAYEATY